MKEFEQQRRESGKAFAAFTVYLNLGEQRSIEAAAKKLRKSRTLLERWSKKFDWWARVQAQGRHLAVVEREATEALVRGRAEQWLKRQEILKEREWAMHEKAIAAAERGLKSYMEREKVYANLADIARMLEVASKLGRLASGLGERNERPVVHETTTVRVEVTLALEKIYGQAVLADGHKADRMPAVAAPIEVESTKVGGQG